MTEEMIKMNGTGERPVEQVDEFCTIVEKRELKVVGIALPINYESRGYGGFSGFKHAGYTLNDYFFTKKLIEGGEIALLKKLLGPKIKNREIHAIRTDVKGDGNYTVIAGYEADDFDGLPEHLPEYTETFTVKAGRYAKILINEKNRSGRSGYEERMNADEYFIGKFRTDTGYVYDPSGCGFNTYDDTGDVLAKYEPVMAPRDESERFASLSFRVVSLPEMKVACAMSQEPGMPVIMKYFEIQDQVISTEAAEYYLHDCYGFPVNTDQEGKFNSCFGTRVKSFEGLPDTIEKVELPGGIYLHITQLEINGDNPSMLYDAAFNHLDSLYLSSHPQYERDWSRHVIARFRQENCASVFVPLLLKESK
jgi:predicted transcriptional regulator YdeE